MDGLVLGDTLDSFRQKRFLTAERRAKGSELAAVPPFSWLRSRLGSPDEARLAGGSPKAREPDLAQRFVQVGRGVRIRLPPAARLPTIGPSPEEDAKIAQEHPAKLSAAAVRPGPDIAELERLRV